MFAGFAIASAVFVIVVFLHIRLKHHVSKEKLHAIENVLRLWPPGVGPPKTVLNEKGLRLHRYLKAAATVFFIGIGIVFVGILVYLTPDNY